jgi:hypothetical protein
MVKSGTLDHLVSNYQQGIKTQGPITIPGYGVIGGTGGAGNPGSLAGNGSLVGSLLQQGGITPFNADDPTHAGTRPALAAKPTQLPGVQTGPTASPDINRGVNFHTQNFGTRTNEGLSDTDRAILHLWGRQIISKGFEDGSVYNNVLADEKLPASQQQYKPAEHDLVNQLVAKETAKYGATNGKELDNLALNLLNQMAGPGQQINIQQYLNAPVRFNHGAKINQVDDLNTLQKQTGLSEFSQAILRAVGHDPLLNGGKIDGSVLAYTIGNSNALDNQGIGANGAVGASNSSVDPDFKALLQDDLTSDGVRNGDSIMTGLSQVLNHVYLGGAQATQQSVLQASQQKAQVAGRTSQQITQGVQQGMVQALADASKMIKNHPVISAAAIGGVAAATAICPFLGGLAVGGAGIAAGQGLINKMAQPA